MTVSLTRRRLVLMGGTVALTALGAACAAAAGGPTAAPAKLKEPASLLY
jgi:hypothetical protein